MRDKLHIILDSTSALMAAVCHWAPGLCGDHDCAGLRRLLALRLARLQRHPAAAGLGVDLGTGNGLAPWLSDASGILLFTAATMRWLFPRQHVGLLPQNRPGGGC